MFHFSHCIVLFNNYIVLYCSSLFFKSSRSLLNVSCILSVGASIHFLRLWIIFTIVALNSFQGWLPIFTSLSCSSGVLSCSFLWNIFSCHLILSNLLCLWSLLLRLQNCNFSCFWCLVSCRDLAHEIPPMTRSWGRKPDGQGGSGFQGFRKADPSAHLKDNICLSDACFNRLLPNFCDTGRRPSPISFQIRINLDL